MTVLDGILIGVREDLEERKRQISLPELRSRVADMAPALDPLPAFGLPGVSIIAEVKRKAPARASLPTSPIPHGWRPSTRPVARRPSVC